jgi:type IV secretory pathway VirJ component
VRDLSATYERDPRACVSPATDLAELGDYLQARYGLAHAAPVLIGHSAGATIAYAALAEAPRGTFAGALTLSFCVDLDLRKPLCVSAALRYSPRPAGGARLLPAAALPAPWTALHGLDDSVCPAPEAREFVTAIPAAHFIGLPGVTHHYWNMDRWWPQFAQAYAELIAAGPPAAAGR